MKTIVLLLLLVLSTSQVLTIPSFDEFIQAYQKQYKEDEYGDRRKNYGDNVNRMLNIHEMTGINLNVSFYADYSKQRFKSYLMTNNAYESPLNSPLRVKSPEQCEFQTQVDWKAYLPGDVHINPIIKCASSWAVAVTTLMYMEYKRKDILWNERFSVQQLLDCVTDKTAHTPITCDGASIESALRYIYEKGICLEKDYRPFTGTRERCLRSSCGRYYIASYKQIYPSFPALLHATSESPIITTFGISPDVLQFYTTIFDNQPNYLEFTYDSYYLSGIVSSYSASTPSYIEVSVPGMNSNSRHILFPFNVEEIDTLSDSTLHSVEELAWYAYGISVKPLPLMTHTQSFDSSMSENSCELIHDIASADIPTLFLYNTIRMIGCKEEDIQLLISSTHKRDVQMEIARHSMLNMKDKVSHTCNIEKLYVKGVLPFLCSYEKGDEIKEGEEGSDQAYKGKCQLSITTLINVLSLFDSCYDLSLISLEDHYLSSEETTLLLKRIILLQASLPQLREINMRGNFISEADIAEARELVRELNENNVTIRGLLLHENTNDYYKFINSPYQESYLVTSLIPLEIAELYITNSPFLYTRKLAIFGSCNQQPQECAYLATSFSRMFQYSTFSQLRSFIYESNQCTTSGALSLLLSLQHSVSVRFISLDNNRIEDSFFVPFRGFIKNKRVLPSLRRISLKGNDLSTDTCEALKALFLRNYNRDIVVLCYGKMGIKGLSKLINQYAPKAIKETETKNYTGRLVAIDASVMIYQYLVAIRSNGQYPAMMLTNGDGDVTSHIQGVLTKTIKFLEDGLKPVYVFEGKPPEMKNGELLKRKENREKAEAELAQAKETGNEEDINKFSKRTVHMDSTHIDDCKTLLRLMGIPVIDAASEAESQCAELAKSKAVWGMASEDMDSLTFGTPFLLRHLTRSQSSAKKDKTGILEVDLKILLEEMHLSQEEFIDMCILCGCDYCDSIKGIGQVKAYQYIQKYRTIEGVIEHLDKKYTVPDAWPYKQARELFLHPEVTKAADVEIKFTEADKEGLYHFLVDEKGFNPERVNGYIEKLDKAKEKSKQKRMDSFFSVKASSKPKEKKDKTQKK